MIKRPSTTSRRFSKKAVIFAVVFVVVFAYSVLSAYSGTLLGISLGRGSLEDGLVLHYTFDELNASSLTVVDESGSGNTGDVSGAVSYTHLRAHETDSYLVC